LNSGVGLICDHQNAAPASFPPADTGNALVRSIFNPAPRAGLTRSVLQAARIADRPWIFYLDMETVAKKNPGVASGTNDLFRFQPGF
jgi:hypothetical protein